MIKFILLLLFLTVSACSDNQVDESTPQQLILEPGECATFYGSFIVTDPDNNWKMDEIAKEYKVCNE